MTSGTRPAAAPVDLSTLSPECAVGMRPGYEDLHGECRQTRDIPLPHGGGIILEKRCRCPHHAWTSGGWA
jgi:hypothetical protein